MSSEDDDSCSRVSTVSAGSSCDQQINGFFDGVLHTMSIPGLSSAPIQVLPESMPKDQSSATVLDDPGFFVVM